ncbi:alpha/beta hydrolase [Massilia sp. YIM B02763]|uniref:alpha/beta hydrolase n=1 Tax=Massilia sp. YIM B02763 TaxID=3050130 RepID=UPI0025B71DF7|nr:alpha/beta hydrolase [Massilia sp. YIM B02763]MDN4051660.1 alpha/beta hydrolase [Massilia sp. YIM B02763]
MNVYHRSSGAGLPVDAATLDEARAFNRKLAYAPRFRLGNDFVLRLGQGLLRLSQIGADRKLARRRLAVQETQAVADGLRVPVRILRPPGIPRAVVLDVHGGGWVIGNARMDDDRNAALALECQALVVSVDYRLATDAPMRDIMDDCLAAARWTLDGGLAEGAGLPVFLVGESAGGHLAAATLLRLKAWPGLLARVKGAVLFYGVYDLAGTPSVRAAGPDTLLLDGPGMVPDMAHLTRDVDDAGRRAPPLSPLYGDLAGMPPALMFAGELDPLRDDTREMAARWAEVAEVEVHMLPEAPHGFIQFPTRMARLALERARQWIAERIG